MKRRSAHSIEPVGETTRDRLLAAARNEFNEQGYDGTDSNRIARRAGFAPQTFYRWFEDKTQIFIEVYNRWWEEEASVLSRLHRENAPTAQLVEALIAHHSAHKRFRRGLRQLTYEDEKVRKARAASRLRQVELAHEWNTTLARDDIAVVLLELERLADALAEDEFSDMGFGPSAAKARLADLIQGLREPARATHKDLERRAPSPRAQR